MDATPGMMICLAVVCLIASFPGGLVPGGLFLCFPGAKFVVSQSSRRRDRELQSWRAHTISLEAHLRTIKDVPPREARGRVSHPRINATHPPETAET
jgi:hypothetical protein